MCIFLCVIVLFYLVLYRNCIIWDCFKSSHLALHVLFAECHYQGHSDGGYIGIYPKISNRFVHVWDINICFEIAMTS